jgi:hypothetical protein
MACSDTDTAQFGTSDGAVCVDNETFFRNEVQATLLNGVCVNCHSVEGLARDSDLVLQTAARGDYVTINEETLSDIAGLEYDGESILLLNPLGMLDHGGGEVIQEGSDEYNILTQYLNRLENPVTCSSSDQITYGTGLELLSPEATLRKSAIMMVGRVPSERETLEVRFGGEEALRQVIREMMEEEAFIDRIKEVFNDLILTNMYLEDNGGIGLVDYERYPFLYWYESEQDEVTRDVMEARTSEAIALEPLEIIAQIVRENRPFTEVLTADYTMVNDYSAMAYGAAMALWPDVNDPESSTFRRVQLNEIPHAGILTTPAYLNRYPTTDTNRNRHRTWAFMNQFMATDLLLLATRPINITESVVHNPTMNDPQCNVCHTVMDPIAGTFQNWDGIGRLSPLEDGWYTDMAAPGFNNINMPSDRNTNSISWLAEGAIQDPRFSLAMVRNVIEGFTGLEMLEASLVAGDAAQEAAYSGMLEFIDDVSWLFIANGYNIKDVVEEVVMSRYFRTAHATSQTSEGDLVLAGTAHMLTPEELSRKLASVTGFVYANINSAYEDMLLTRYYMLYGGIDSDSIIHRLTLPNGIIANIQLRMATEIPCQVVEPDFTLPSDQRRLFPYVELDTVPLRANNSTDTEMETAILENIRYLHSRFLGEELEITDPEIQAAYSLWYLTWREGNALIESGLESSFLPATCIEYDFNNGGLPSNLIVGEDPNFVMRSWMALLSYYIADYEFLYE